MNKYSVDNNNLKSTHEMYCHIGALKLTKTLAKKLLIQQHCTEDVVITEFITLHSVCLHVVTAKVERFMFFLCKYVLQREDRKVCRLYLHVALWDVT